MRVPSLPVWLPNPKYMKHNMMAIKITFIETTRHCCFLCCKDLMIWSTFDKMLVSFPKMKTKYIYACTSYLCLKIFQLANPNTFNKLRCAMETDMFDATTPRRKELIQHWYRTSEAYMKILLAIGTCTLAAW